MKERVIKIFIIIITINIIIYLTMLFDTNPLMSEVRDAFLWKINTSETINRPLSRYNFSYYSDKGETLGHADLTLLRLFVFHNFKDGYIWAFYTYQAYNTEGDLLNSSANIPTKWKIHKENGKWEIVDIFEDP